MPFRHAALVQIAASCTAALFRDSVKKYTASYSALQMSGKMDEEDSDRLQSANPVKKH